MRAALLAPSPAAERRRAARRWAADANGHDGLVRAGDSQSAEEQGGGQPLLLAAVFVLGLLVVGYTFATFPSLTSEELADVRGFSLSADYARALYRVMARYRDDHYWSVFAAFCEVYIFFQAFGIPGPLLLSILAGPLFGVWRGGLLVSVLATAGASLCYGLSYFLGRGLVRRCYAAPLARLRQKIHKHRHNLFFYMLFLRISPLLPNWFINISSPILNVPFHTFVAATALGLLPANAIHVTTGLQLSEIDSVGFDLRKFAALFLLAFLALIPTLFRKKFEAIDAKDD